MGGATRDTMVAIFVALPLSIAIAWRHGWRWALLGFALMALVGLAVRALGAGRRW